MGIILLCLLSFITGAFCFYWPLRKWKQKINSLVPIPFEGSFSNQGNLTHLSNSTESQSKLELYIAYLRDQNKRLWEKHVLSKKISHEISSAIQECVIILDKRGQVLFHNPQSRFIFYLDKKGTDPLQINEMVRSPDVIDLFEECLQKQTQIHKECAFRKKDQNIKSRFKVTSIPVCKSSSEKADPQSIEKVILIFYDQTAIQESQQAHIDFVSNVSHELKTPLTSLQGYVEMLLQDFKSKKMDQFESFLQILLRNCKRISNLVNDLLTLSNLISQANMEKKKLSTKGVTQKVMKNINSKTHQIHFSFLADHVIAHPLWVETVLHNLVDNACQHTPEKSDVHIFWEKSSSGVLLKVRDTGEGIPEKYQQRVFERFFRIDPARSRAKGGTGVGLSLVKQALEKQGGSVRVVSSPHQGAEFICEFPNT